ncbi:hypothetical protein FH609_007435 [Streptomyces sp. 3MP-14]|uniref:Uncharacterized protein n=1 Tax=Streptomyces mimosae TaxID=2586635 RepID=A0A5N6AKV8_9ACTN|nr:MULTISPECIES: hypothetical protein [Streptomyces]KAB8168762.1 hypothetical protein FH607_005930 [Streptomyces mimosae]KAB8177958.1 hypothetical protein FH609_007435 [Streptomyces sp. 3MP-14]
MELESAIALVTAAAGSVATEAGRHAWESLMSLTRRITGRADPVVPDDEESVRVLVGEISDRAEADEEFADQLRDWAATHQPALDAQRSTVHNKVGGNAQVSGPVIQAQNITGPITFGS